MSPPTHETPAVTPGLSSNSTPEYSEPTEYPKKSRRKRPGPTQAEQVKSMLSGGWVCGTSFLEMHLPRYSPRIYELRGEGFQIDRRACENAWHDHWSTQHEWRIVGLPGEPHRLPGFGDR